MTIRFHQVVVTAALHSWSIYTFCWEGPHDERRIKGGPLFSLCIKFARRQNILANHTSIDFLEEMYVN